MNVLVLYPPDTVAALCERCHTLLSLCAHGICPECLCEFEVLDSNETRMLAAWHTEPEGN